MKFLAILVILLGFAMVGSTFFGIYTVPGLEGLPTVESLKQKNKKAKEGAVKGKSEENPSGIFPVNSNGAASQRRNYLNQNQEKVAPGG